eukprot:1136935-Pelagomonas_calceolata.AAC.3
MAFWERAYKASGSFKGDYMFLVVEVNVPEGIANALVYMRLGMGEEDSDELGLASSQASQAIL